MKKLLLTFLLSLCVFGAAPAVDAADVWVYSGKGADVYVDTSSIYPKSSTEFNVVVQFKNDYSHDPGSTQIYHFFVRNGQWMFNTNPDTIATGRPVDSDFLAKKVFAVCV